MTRITTTTRLGAALIALTGLIHLVEAPGYLDEKTYVGVLFLLAPAGSALAPAGLWRPAARPAGALGALTAIGCFAGYVLSRPTGLPGGFKGAEFAEPLGIVSLL